MTRGGVEVPPSTFSGSSPETPGAVAEAPGAASITYEPSRSASQNVPSTATVKRASVHPAGPRLAAETRAPGIDAPNWSTTRPCTTAGGGRASKACEMGTVVINGAPDGCPNGSKLGSGSTGAAALPPSAAVPGPTSSRNGGGPGGRSSAKPPSAEVAGTEMGSPARSTATTLAPSSGTPPALRVPLTRERSLTRGSRSSSPCVAADTALDFRSGGSPPGGCTSASHEDDGSPGDVKAPFVSVCAAIVWTRSGIAGAWSVKVTDAPATGASTPPTSCSCTTTPLTLRSGCSAKSATTLE